MGQKRRGSHPPPTAKGTASPARRSEVGHPNPATRSTLMFARGTVVGLFTLAALALSLAAGRAAIPNPDEKKAAKNGEESRKGAVTGVVTAKGETWIEVKGDGEKKARRYVPHWRG